MKKKPDIMLVLAVIFGLGVLVSSYTQGEISPESVAKQYVIR